MNTEQTTEQQLKRCAILKSYESRAFRLAQSILANIHIAATASDEDPRLKQVIDANWHEYGTKLNDLFTRRDAEVADFDAKCAEENKTATQETEDPAAQDGNPDSDAQDEADAEQYANLKRKLMRSLKLQSCLEVAWWVVIAFIALVGTTYAIGGQWQRAINNALWLFVAWMYWRQTHAQSNILQTFIDLLKKCILLREQNNLLKKMIDNYKQMKSYYEKINQINEGIIHNYEQITKAGEDMVKSLNPKP